MKSVLVIDKGNVLNNGAKYNVTIEKVVNISKEDLNPEEFVSYKVPDDLKSFLKDSFISISISLAVKYINVDSGGVLATIMDEDLSEYSNITLIFTLSHIYLNKRFELAKKVIIEDFLNYCVYKNL